MHISTVPFAFFIAILGTFTIAAPVADTVITPGGRRTRNNVHQVPAGGRIAHIGKDIHVFASNGSVVHVATPNGTASAPGFASGWITYASWLNTGAAIGSFKTSWTVPPAPATWNNQLIYLFNSIEPSNGDAIMQPVLQYGLSQAGGGQSWGVASWYLYADQVFHTNLVPVSVGQRLDGEVQLVGTQDTTFNYNSQFTNIQGTGLVVQGSEQLVLATVTLEAYAVIAKSDYPAGSTVFSGTNLELSNGQFPAISWSTNNDAADMLSTSIDVDGSTSATIEIHYDH